MSLNHEVWHIAFDRGKASLAKHNPEKALKSFESALATCPVDKPKDLARILYYLGVALHRLGMSSCALKSWSSAHRLDRQGYSGKFLLRFANGYGMAKQKTKDLDDWKAFHAVQLVRYLSLKKSGKLGTDAERDMIWELILEEWKGLRNSLDLAAMSSEEKLGLFRAFKIVFPFFSLPEENGEPPIPVDFARQKRVTLDDQCFCGSGLPYRLCCGRTPGQDELNIGVI
jgi:tetratricopeptide (TPR) repeat protein